MAGFYLQLHYFLNEGRNMTIASLYIASDELLSSKISISELK
jgi:hypothetical protein